MNKYISIFSISNIETPFWQINTVLHLNLLVHSRTKKRQPFTLLTDRML